MNFKKIADASFNLTAIFKMMHFGTFLFYDVLLKLVQLVTSATI